MKDMFKEGKEANKNSNEKDEKKGEFPNLNQSMFSSGNQTSGSSPNRESGGNSSTTQAPAGVNSSSTGKPGGLMDMMSDMAKKGKDAIKDVIEPKKDEKTGSRGGLEETSGKEGPIDKVTKLVSKGTELVKDKMHIIEDKAKDVTDKVSKVIDDKVVKPMSTTSGSGQKGSEGQLSAEATANNQLRGSEKEKHLVDLKRKQESELPNKPTNLKDVVNEAKSRGSIPQNEDRSVLRGNHDDEKSLAVEVFDKAHEISKIPVEKVLKPIDKMLGYEKDPLLRVYDNSHAILRKPLEMVSKPVESVFTGAFKTSDESKKDSEKVLATMSEQERKDSKLLEEKAKKANRSVAGQIADKTLDLALKPLEVALRPIDHLFGFDKNGKKNPLVHMIEELYAFSKKPLDKIVRPFESILKKMGDDDQQYQVAVRFNADKDDPKLFTRLADGYLNIADRVMTKPLELFMKPLDHVLGFDEPGKKNPIVEAAHSLKNATKIGVELFTKPIDRIVKNVAEIGEFKTESEREAFYQRQKEEASRLVKVLDKMHELAQAPFEVIIRPVRKVIGKQKEPKKEPFLRAWDVVHQVIRTPWQVISKPVEDAILGPRKVKPGASAGANATANASANATASANSNSTESRGALTAMIAAGKVASTIKQSVDKKNIFIDKIKRFEKLATRPFELITAPIRRLILGEDNAKVGSYTEKNNREIQAKSRSGDAAAQSKSDSKGDKIMTTLEKMNNVMLKPLEVMTQPLADILNSDKGENKMDKLKQQPQKQEQPEKSPAQQAPPSFQARAQAAQKKN